MKRTDIKLFRAVLLVTALLITANLTVAQTVLYTENFGEPTSTTLVQNYTGWQNNSVTYLSDGTCDIRTSYASSGYDNASGGGNLMINDTLKWFQISGIAIDSQNNLQLRAGLRKTTATDGTGLVVQASVDGSEWIRLPLLDTLATGTGTSGWHWVHYGGIPEGTTLTLRFSNSGNVDYRLDDLLLVGGQEAEDTTTHGGDDVAVLDWNHLTFCIYPNPTQGTIKVHYGNLSLQTLSLTDLAGHTLMRWEDDFPTAINMGLLRKGVYVLKVEAAEGTFCRKVLRY